MNTSTDCTNEETNKSFDNQESLVLIEQLSSELEQAHAEILKLKKMADEQAFEIGKSRGI